MAMSQVLGLLPRSDGCGCWLLDGPGDDGLLESTVRVLHAAVCDSLEVCATGVRLRLMDPITELRGRIGLRHA